MTATRWMVALTLAAGTLTVQAQPRPYYGSWVVNSAKSDFKAVTATYKDIGGNRIEISGMGQKDVWIVGRDGKDYPWFGGSTITWRDAAPNRWETINKRDGQMISKYVWTLSADGSTVTAAMTNVMPDGRTSESATTLVRVSGGPGPFGTFRTAAISGGFTLEAAAPGVIYRWEGVAEARCQFDGKHCPLTGAVPSGASMSLRELGPRSFEYQEQSGGAVTFTSRLTVSDDGQTLHEEQTMATGEKARIVYERRK